MSAPDPVGVTYQLPSRGPLRWESILRFLAPRAVPGIERQVGNRFRRNLPGGWIELGPTTDPGAAEPATGSETLTVTGQLAGRSDLGALLPLARVVADLDADLEAIAAHLMADPMLAPRLAGDDSNTDQGPGRRAPRARRVGRLPGTFDRFELAVRAVVGQQVSVAAATTTLGRLVELTSPEPEARFPSAGELAVSDRLDELGMPQRRRTTLRALARAVADGDVELGPGTDPGRCRRQLLAIDGIGPWTAGYITMRALSDPDGWPVGDLGLRRSLGVSAAELERRAERWRPWRAYAALLLWQTDPTATARPDRQPPSTTTPTPRASP